MIMVKIRLEFPELWLMIEALTEKIAREEIIVANSSPDEDRNHDSQDNIKICTDLIEKLEKKRQNLRIYNQKVYDEIQDLRRRNITDLNSISKVLHLKKGEED